MAHDIPDPPPPITTEISTVVETWKNAAPVIRRRETYDKAVEALRVCQVMRREVKKHYTPIKQSIHSSKQTVLKLERDHLQEILPTEEKLMGMVVDYEDREAERLKEDATRALKHPSDTTIAALNHALSDPKGQARRITRTPIVEDLGALVKAVADGVVPIETIQANIPYLRKMAQSQGDLFLVPGVNLETRVRVVLL